MGPMTPPQRMQVSEALGWGGGGGQACMDIGKQQLQVSTGRPFGFNAHQGVPVHSFWIVSECTPNQACL